MKKHRIFGIGLVLTLLVSLIAMAVPAAAAPPGDGNWIKQSQPVIPAFVIDSGADVNSYDIAEGSGRVYLIDTGQDKLKTGTSGTVWSSLDNLVDMYGATLSFVAVAPDDDLAIAVADAAAGVVYISNDGGINWSVLPTLPGTGTITGIDVGPARTGSLLGREYIVAMADDDAGDTGEGDVLIIGQTASWISLAGVTGAADFMFAQFSPLYIGDRVVMAGGVTAGGTVNVWVLNVATNANVSYSPVTVFTGGVDYQGGVAGLANMDIAMPSDFDPTSAGFMRAWVSTGHVGGNANDDVYRISGASAKDLNAVTAVQAIDSVGYAGTNDAGTLFAGYTGTTCVVKMTDQAQSNVPTWSTSRNSPTGDGFVDVTPAIDFASSNKVFAGTTGWQSAWSISENGGTSFYQRSAIDNGHNDWGDIESIVPVPDGSGFWLLTDSNPDLEVWFTPNPPSSMSSKRYEVLLNVAAADGVIGNAKLLVNPDWAASPTLFVHDMDGGQLYISQNGGDTWITRYVPANTDVLVVVDSTTLYAFEGTNFHKSTNMGWTWEPSVAWTTSGTATDAVVADDGTIFVGYSSGTVRKSTNGGASWSTAVTYGSISDDVFVLVDPDYDSNGYIYLASMDNGTVIRSDPATNTWRSISYPGGAAVGMQMVDGVLYVADADGVWACNGPAGPAPSWKGADEGDLDYIPANDFVAMSGNSVNLFLVKADDTWGYIDYISASKTTVTAPSMVAVDPVSGYAAPFQLKWEVIGTGLGKSNKYDIYVRDSATKQYLNMIESGTNAVSYQVTGALAVFESGKSYDFRVRAIQQSGGDDLRSLWSDYVTVKVASGSKVEQPYASPQVLGPVGGATTSQNPGFAWAPVTGATEYEFVLATDPALSKTVAGTPVKLTTPSFQASGLDYDTTYFWGVMVTKPNPGPQTVSTFTVMAEPAPPEPAPTTTIEVPPQPTPTVIVTAPPAPAPAEPAIPAVAIWVVIGVGAVLIIVIIVLIVRTRRPV
jgi:hypothetical protein